MQNIRMVLIYEQEYPRTLDGLIERFSAGGTRRLDTWTFDDAGSRQRAEAALAASGVQAKFRSAYKPLLHFFLEEVDLVGLSAVHIVYPVHAACEKKRFLLEAYPLAGLVGEALLTFEAAESPSLFYDVTLTAADGGVSARRVFAPNRIHRDLVGETMLSPTGWLAVDGDAGERFETDYEALFRATTEAVAAHGWGPTEPYFDELNISATLPVEDHRLSFREEAVSLREALHEDLYFSLLEFFQKKSGRPAGDRGLRPGQIVPEIRFGETVSVRVETRPLSSSEREADTQPLNCAAAPIAAGQVRQELSSVGGILFEAAARSGRVVHARYHAGSDRPIIISGGQHANETSGIVGALRAAKVLASRPNGHFVISPLENPDGHQIHWRLRADNPFHMHHAARYTAFGDDLEYRSGGNLMEKAIRVEAMRLSGAELHLNLHGYPSHEWTRPLSGYVPRGFSMWTVPKGFFLILRHHAAWAAQAALLLDRVTRHLAALPGLLEFNRSQVRLFEIHAGDTGLRDLNGIPCMVSVDDRQAVPLTLITEYPDETIYGGGFIAAHTAQMETVLSAYDAIQTIGEPSADIV